MLGNRKVGIGTRNGAIVTGLCCLGMGMSGCADPASPPQETSAWAQVEDALSGEAVVGVKLVVMTRDGNRLVTGPILSNEHGRCSLAGLPAGDYRVLVFGGASHRPLVSATSLSMPADGGKGIRVLVVPLARPGGLPRLSGTVSDAQTGEPLAGAFVSTSSFLTAYEGDTGPRDNVTGRDGAFKVADIPFGQDPLSGNLVQILPLLITRAGFEPAVFTYRAPNGSGELDVAGLRIALRRIDGAEPALTATVCGRLLRGRVPAAGVAVGLGFAGGDKGAVGAPGWVAVSDPEGRFCLAGLLPGRYVLHPGYLVGDGAVFPDQPGNRPWDVGAGGTVDAGDLTLLREIDPVEPAHGGLAGAVPTRLVWSAVPGAAEYQVVLDGEDLAAIQTPAYDLPDTLTIAAGWHWWGVTARDAGGAAVGVMQVPAWFELRDQDTR